MGPSQAVLSVGEAEPPKIEVKKKEKHGVKDGPLPVFTEDYNKNTSQAPKI